MTNASKFAINIKFNSFTETFINEFSGIPGIELKLMSPTYFKLIDIISVISSPQAKVNTISKACGVIKVVRCERTNESPLWEFRYASRITNLYETFYSVNENSHACDQTYSINTILIEMLKAYYKLTYMIEPHSDTYKYFSHSIPYINVGVRFVRTDHRNTKTLNPFSS